MRREKFQNQWRVEAITPEIRANVTRYLSEKWKEAFMWVREERLLFDELDGFVIVDARELMGVITYVIQGGICEIVSLNSERESQGIGTILIQEVVQTARAVNCSVVRLLTTNDNLRAIGFYQKRGFDWVGIRLHAMDRIRKIQPSIPLIGDNGIPLHHEIDFSMKLMQENE